MHILLTDVLCCPRCGPEHGLIMLADRLVERRIIEGRLGCANCRNGYRVQDGVADLRYPPATGDRPARPAVADDADAAVRLAALLGLTGGAPMALLAGDASALAARLASLLPDVEVIASDPPRPYPPGVSVVLTSGGRLPFRSLSLRAVALGRGATADPLEALRTVAVGGRLVVDELGSRSRARLEENGARILLDEEGVAVASRERHL